MPCPSYDSEAIKAQWILEVFHKHDAWNEFGDGTSIQCPIWIIQNDVSAQNFQQF
jgi:hypothetical protein